MFCSFSVSPEATPRRHPCPSSARANLPARRNTISTAGDHLPASLPTAMSRFNPFAMPDGPPRGADRKPPSAPSTPANPVSHTTPTAGTRSATTTRAAAAAAAATALSQEGDGFGQARAQMLTWETGNHALEAFIRLRIWDRKHGQLMVVGRDAHTLLDENDREICNSAQLQRFYLGVRDIMRLPHNPEEQWAIPRGLGRRKPTPQEYNRLARLLDVIWEGYRKEAQNSASSAATSPGNSGVPDASAAQADVAAAASTALPTATGYAPGSARLSNLTYAQQVAAIASVPVPTRFRPDQQSAYLTAQARGLSIHAASTPTHPPSSAGLVEGAQSPQTPQSLTRHLMSAVRQGGAPSSDPGAAMDLDHVPNGIGPYPVYLGQAPRPVPYGASATPTSRSSVDPSAMPAMPAPASDTANAKVFVDGMNTFFQAAMANMTALMDRYREDVKELSERLHSERRSRRSSHASRRRGRGPRFSRRSNGVREYAPATVDRPVIQSPSATASPPVVSSAASVMTARTPISPTAAKINSPVPTDGDEDMAAGEDISGVEVASVGEEL